MGSLRPQGGGGGTLSPNSVTDTEIAAHTSTKITITAKGQLNSSIAYEDEANTFGAGLKQTVSHDATTAGLNVGPVSGNPSGLANGDIWINDTTNQIFARINGLNVDLGAGAAGGISNVVEDATPQLGGQLDVNGNSLGDGTLELLSFIETASAVNELTITNAATTGAPSLTATGDDANIDLTLDGKGTGVVKTLSSNLDITGDIIVSGTVDGIDLANAVLNNQANSYSAGSKQSFLADATTAGLNINNQVPSTTVGGDIWRATDALTYRNNADTADLIIATRSDNLSVFASTTSTELRGVISDETGTGGLVFSDSPSLLTPTITIPTIASFADATHNHQNAAGGGNLATTAITAGTFIHERGGLEADVSAFTGLLAISGGVTSEVDTKAELQAQISDVADFAEADGDTYSGAHLFNAATMRIPLSATPTMAVDGDFAIDTTITDFSHGLIKYFDGEELAVIAVPIAQLTTPTDGHVITYNATNDEFELVAGGGGSDNLGNHTATQDLDMATFDIDNAGVIFLNEQAEANVDVAGQGQIWVDTQTPNVLFFTDDAGTDFRLSFSTSAQLAAMVSDETGTGALVFGTSPSITTPTISGAISFPDGVRQTFNPDGTTPGLNVGSNAGDPSTPANGDVWYNSTTERFRKRQNGVTEDMDTTGAGATGTIRIIEENGTAVATDRERINIVDGTTVAFTVTDDAGGDEADVTAEVADTSLTNAKFATGVFGAITGLGEQTQDLDMGGNNIDDGGVIFLREQIDADADVAGQGQIWVDTQTPNVLFFTDDAGTDFRINFSTSAQLAAMVSDETGSGSLVFATSPTLVTPALGTPSAGVLTNCTGLPTTGIVDNAVTFAKMQNITTDRLLGRDTAATGDPEEIALDDTLEFTGTGSIQRAALTGDITSAAGSNATAIAAGVIVDADVSGTADIGIAKLDANVANATGDTFTGVHDFGGATSLEIPNSATPTVDADGEVAVDTTVTDFSHGVMKYFGGEEMGVVAMPIAQFTTPTGGNVVAYNATTDEFELVAAGAADNLGDHTATQDLDMATFDVDNAGVIFLNEQADANADVAGQGQIWVDTQTPNVLFFTDDAGTDFRLSFSTSAQLAAMLSDETGTGVAVFGTSPTITTPTLAGSTGTGVHDFGGATSFEIPNSATPTVDAAGEIAVDTTITDFTGLIKYHDGTEELAVVAMPVAQLTTPTDNHVVQYNATTDEFELAAAPAGAITFTDVIPCVMEVPQGTEAYPDVHTLATQVSKISGFVMPTAADSTINFKVSVPKDLAASPTATIRFRTVTLSANTTDAINITVRTRHTADTENIDQAFNVTVAATNYSVSDTIESYDVHTAALGTQPVADDIITGQLFRDVSADAAGDVLIVGIDLLIDRTIG